MVNFSNSHIGKLFLRLLVIHLLVVFREKSIDHQLQGLLFLLLKVDGN